MSKWYCGRCKTYVRYLEWCTYGYKPCECEEGPSPWWFVPSTGFEKIACWLGLCLYKGTCVKCDKGPKL